MEHLKWFRRGFVESVQCPAAAWLEHADALLAAAPVREARLTTWPPLHRHGMGVWSFEGRRHVEAIPEGWDAVGTLLAAEWPGVRFALPIHRDLSILDGGAITPNEARRFRPIIRG